MRWFVRWYGANPLHLLTAIACFALAGYAADRLRTGDYVGILVWVGGAVIGHDLILVPLYTIADRSIMAVFRRRPPSLPAVPWINYLRVPVVLSAILLMIWFPLIFRLPTDFPGKTDLSLGPYLGHWLAVTGALFLLSAAALAVRLRPGRRPPASRRPDPSVRRTGGYDSGAYHSGGYVAGGYDDRRPGGYDDAVLAPPWPGDAQVWRNPGGGSPGRSPAPGPGQHRQRHG